MHWRPLGRLAQSLSRDLRCHNCTLDWQDALGCPRLILNVCVQNQALLVVQHGLKYLKSCFIKDPSGYKIPLGDVYVYQVGDPKEELRLWRRPEDVKVCALTSD
jgi:hypothetical protein